MLTGKNRKENTVVWILSGIEAFQGMYDSDSFVIQSFPCELRAVLTKSFTQIETIKGTRNCTVYENIHLGMTFGVTFGVTFVKLLFALRLEPSRFFLKGKIYDYICTASSFLTP